MVSSNSIIPQTVRRFLFLVTKKCRIYAACGVSQTPKIYIKEKEKGEDSSIYSINKKSVVYDPLLNKKMNTVILFQGQGNYKTKYCRELLDKKSKLKKIWEDASDILGWSILDLLYQTENVGILPTIQAQPIIFLMEYSSWLAYKNDLKSLPRYLAGHSLGELVALVAAEACTFEAGFRLVCARGGIMQNFSNEVEQGMMALYDCSEEEAQTLCEEVRNKLGKLVYCANFNSSNQIIVSGDSGALDYISEIKDINVQRLQVKKAFHTPFMFDAAEQFKKYLSDVSFSYPKIPVMSNVTARPYQASWTISDLLYKQIFSPVRWEEIMSYFIEKGVMNYFQVSDSRLFQNMSNEYSESFQWGTMEDFANGKIRDFDKIYFESNSGERNSEELCGELLKAMLAYPWKNSDEGKVNEVKSLYNEVMQISKIVDYQKNQIAVCMKNLKKVLEIKGVDDEKVRNSCTNIMEKYGISDIDF